MTSINLFSYKEAYVARCRHSQNQSFSLAETYATKYLTLNFYPPGNGKVTEKEGDASLS